MAKSQLSRYERWVAIFFVAILIGIGLSSFFGIEILGFVGFSLLVFGILGIVVVRRKVSELKRTNSEFFKTLEAENKKAVEPRDHEVRLKDYPRWLLAMFIAAVAVCLMVLAGLFNFNAFLEDSLLAFAIASVIYFGFYQSKIKKQKKKRALSQNANQSNRENFRVLERITRSPDG